jgi:ketosteroid isomerase-like protein
MSDDQVETARRAIAAFNGRDRDGLRVLFDPSAEVTPVRAALDGTVFRGRDAPAEYCAAIEDSWDDLWWELEELRAGPDLVLALGRIHGRGRDTGVTIDARGGWLLRFRGSLIIHFRTFSDRADALREAGLAQQS